MWLCCQCPVKLLRWWYFLSAALAYHTLTKSSPGTLQTQRSCEIQRRLFVSKAAMCKGGICVPSSSFFWQRQVKVNIEERKIEIALNSGWHHTSVQLLLAKKDKLEQTHNKKKQDRKMCRGSTPQHLSDLKYSACVQIWCSLSSAVTYFTTSSS